MATFTNVSGPINLTCNLTEIITTGVVSSYNLGAVLNRNVTYSNGTAAGMIDLVYAKQLSLAGAVTTLDLTALTDMNGAAINFARVRELIIQSLATTAAFTLAIGNAASNAWTGFLGATSIFTMPTNVGATGNYATTQWSDPYTVGAATGAYVDGTHKNLKLDPGANTFSVNIIIAGCSAVS
jgi:hypothetical protein